MSAVKKTPLAELHKAGGAKMIPFGGWLMPVSYKTVLTEHHHVRQSCGIFDVSHMGEVIVKGAQATEFLQYLTINDVKRLQNGQGQYSAILNEQGGIIDDLILYRLADNEYLICVNASNIDKDFTWIKNQVGSYQVTVTNESTMWGQVAVQGPLSRTILLGVLGEKYKDLIATLPYTNIAPLEFAGAKGYLARTGYTGEVGFEVYLPNEATIKLWQTLLLNAPEVAPIGLGARDTLRLEACYLLYGNDMNDSVSPLEAGIGWATRFDCGDFIGRTALLAQKERGIERRLVAFTMVDDGIPRHDMAIYDAQDNRIGFVTSGSVLPTVGGAGGLAMISGANYQPGQEIWIDMRGKRKLGRVVKKPLYTPRVKD